MIESILINMDSNQMKKEINKRNVNIDLVSKRYFSSVYAHSLMLYSTLLGYYSREDYEDFEVETLKEIKDNLNSVLEFVFKLYGSFLLNFDADLSDVS